MMRKYLPGQIRMGVFAALWALMAAALPWAHAQSGRGARIQSLEQVALERGGCFGSCPVYRITISGDGRVEYWGMRYVKTAGIHTKILSLAAMRQLTDELNRADYLGFRDRYDSREAGCTDVATDSPSVKISVRADGKLKAIEHYLGCSGPASDRLANLENTVDRIAGTSEWIGIPGERETHQARNPAAGNSSTIAIPADFERDRTGQDIVRFYRQAARSGNCQAARRLSEIYARGIQGVVRDYAESVSWQAQANSLGCGAPTR